MQQFLLHFIWALKYDHVHCSPLHNIQLYSMYSICSISILLESTDYGKNVIDPFCVERSQICWQNDVIILYPLKKKKNT